MLGEWLQPILEWLGIGLVPFLIILLGLILIFKD